MTITISYQEPALDDPDGTVRLEPDMLGPREVFVESRNERDSHLDVEMHMVFNSEFRQYFANWIRVQRREESDSVSGAGIRSIRVQDYVQSGLQDVRWIDSKTGEDIPTTLPDDLVERIKLLGPSNPETMRWVARIHQRAFATSQRPAKAVQEQLQLTAPTASVWIRRARDTGILPAPEYPDDGIVFQ